MRTLELFLFRTLALAGAFTTLAACSGDETKSGAQGAGGFLAGGAAGAAGASPGGAGSGGAFGNGGTPGAGGAVGGSGGAMGGMTGMTGMGGSMGGALGSGGAPGSGGASAGGAQGSGGTPEVPTEHFSFFVTSLRALQDLSGSQQGFGGDLRFGETGAGAGLRGADKICATIADRSMPGASAKGWRAFLSATAGENGTQVDAIDRIGEGPWYDRLGRLFANNKADLLHFRPEGADPAIINDFPNEDGVPNQDPDATGPVDNHDTLTGTNAQGRLYSATATCLDWTSAVGDPATSGNPRVGHSWPRTAGGQFMGFFMGGGDGDGYGHWMSSLDEAGCAPGVSLIEMGPPNPLNPTVGSGGGYGGFYCFALVP